MIVSRKPIKVGRKKFTFVAVGYKSDMNKKAREQAARGYTYRIVKVGRKSVLYIGPQRRRTKGTRRVGKLRRVKRRK